MEVPTKGIFEKRDKRIHLKTKYCEFYIPKDLIKSELVEIVGNLIKAFGLFPVGIYDDDKFLGYRPMKIPAMVGLNVYDTESTTIKPHDSPIDVLVLKYHQGDDIMSSEIPRSVINVEKFTNLMMSGHLPQPLNYAEIANLWSFCFEINGINPKTAACILELIPTVLCRDPASPSNKYSRKYAEGGSPYGYTPMSIRDCCKYSSVFSAITFEDLSTMITSSLNSSVENKDKNQIPSVLEKTLKY